MNTFRGPVAAIVIVALTSYCWSEDKKDNTDAAKNLIGKWEVTKSEKELPVGSTIEFTKDGSMTIVAKKKDGTLETTEATYKVEGDKLQFMFKDNQEAKDPVTIKAISEKELILVAPKKMRTWEFKRVKFAS